MSVEMQNRVTGSQLVILPRGGHMTFVDQPNMFLDAVRKFIAK